MILPSNLIVSATGPSHEPLSDLRYSSVLVPLPEPIVSVSLLAAKLLSPPGLVLLVLQAIQVPS